MADQAQETRTVLLPVKTDEVRNPEGGLVSDVVPETWGIPVEVRRVKVNYHDVGKFVVRGAPDKVAALAEKSRAHFAEVWKRPGADDDDE